MFEQMLFFLFGSVLLLAAVAMVTVRSPVHAALALILAFFNSAALWLLLEAEFLGIVLVMVYVGAVMVLFLFVIMMLDSGTALREGFVQHLPMGLVVAVTVAVEMILVLQRGAFDSGRYLAGVAAAGDAKVSNTEALGELIFTEYLYPFEIAGVVLLVAIIAAIMLTLRQRAGVRSQDVGKQLRVQRADRVRLVKMKPEQR